MSSFVMPSSFSTLLDELVKRMSFNGEAKMGASTEIQSLGDLPPNKMIFHPFWCLYACEKTKSSHSIDADELADNLVKMNSTGQKVSMQFMATTHGSGAVAKVNTPKRDDHGCKESLEQTSNSSSLSAPTRIANLEVAKSPEVETTDGSTPDIVWPLPTSKSQERILTKLLCEDYLAVLVEGPPGTLHP